MTLLAGTALLAGIALGTFAAIVTIVAGLALLALDVERQARVASMRVRVETRRRRAQLAARRASSPEGGRAVRRRHVPRATH